MIIKDRISTISWFNSLGFVNLWGFPTKGLFTSAIKNKDCYERTNGQLILNTTNVYVFEIDIDNSITQFWILINKLFPFYISYFDVNFITVNVCKYSIFGGLMSRYFQNEKFESKQMSIV